MKHHRPSFFRNDDAEGTALGDVTMNSLMIFFFLFLIVSAVLSQRTKHQENVSVTPNLGKMLIELTWPPGSVDVDAWILPPDAKKPIGFSNRGGQKCDLLRDDRGTTDDDTPSNHESILCRTSPPGDYVVVPYFYADYREGVQTPVTANVVISLWDDTSSRFVQKYNTTFTLKPKGHGTISFTLDGNGAIVLGSLNTIQRNIFGGE